jgi:hypothetical protein
MAMRWDVSVSRIARTALPAIALGVASVACSPGATASGASTRRHATSTTSTGVSVATLPIEIAPASLEVSKSSATIKFATGNVTGPLRLTLRKTASTPTRLVFGVSGVRYRGLLTVPVPSGGLISSASLRGTGSTVTIDIGLRRGHLAHRTTIIHDQIRVHVS